MLVKILISPLLESRIRGAEEILTQIQLTQKHPDVLWFPNHSKLGVEQANTIREHLSLKPYSANNRAIVIESAQNFTLDAQNALLKTLEEPPENAVIILGAETEHNLLPTVLSRCNVEFLEKTPFLGRDIENYDRSVEGLIDMSLEERFEYIEKLKDREGFLQTLIIFFQKQLKSQPGNGILEFAKDLLQAEEWVKSNGNIRAILEYLMLKIP